MRTRVSRSLGFAPPMLAWFITAIVLGQASVASAQRPSQRLHRLHIQMMCRFVKEEKIAGPG